MTIHISRTHFLILASLLAALLVVVTIGGGLMAGRVYAQSRARQEAPAAYQAPAQRRFDPTPIYELQRYLNGGDKPSQDETCKTLGYTGAAPAMQAGCR